MEEQHGEHHDLAGGGEGCGRPDRGGGARRTAANHPDIVAVRTADDVVSLTWSELLKRVEVVAGGLAKLGVGRATRWRSCSVTAPSSM